MIFTEGTDATGGEFNVGDRLVTGVADGRIAQGSSDAVNGHQLFQVATAIGVNSEAINDLRDGAAALASILDLYLGSDETWSLSGGFSVYDDGAGSTQAGFGGGFQMRGSTPDRWSVGVAGAVSGSSATVRVQGRIGG